MRGVKLLAVSFVSVKGEGRLSTIQKQALTVTSCSGHPGPGKEQVKG